MSDAARASGVAALSAWPRTSWFLTTPPEASRTIARPRVVDALDAAVRANQVVAVAAPSGFGKTTAVAQWARGADRAVAWLSLTRFDRDAERIASGVVAAVGRALPDEAARALRVSTVDFVDAAAVVDLVTSALGAGPDDLVLVVDQAEYANDLAASVIGALAVKRPPHLRIVVISTAPLRELVPLLGSGIETAGLDATLLAFDDDEIAALARTVGAPRAASASVRERTAGWPVAVRLEIAGARANADRDLEDYVEDEILARMDPRLAEVIRATTIATPFDVELATGLTGRADTAIHLEACVRDGLFLDRYSRDGRRIYVWHAAFRAAVVASEERRDPAAVAARHALAAELLVESDPLRAIEHYAAAHRPGDAYRVILESWLEILQDGRAGALARACTGLPGEWADRAAVLGIRACCAWAARDAEGARLLMRRAGDDAPRTPPERTATAVAGLLTTDDPDELRTLVVRAHELLGHPGAVSHRAMAPTLFAVGYTALRLRRGPVDAIATLRSALREADLQERHRLAAHIAGSLAFALAFVGFFSEALVLAERSRLVTPGDEWLVYDGGSAACAAGFVAYWRDELPAARLAFEDVRRLASGPTAYEPVARMYDAQAAAAAGDLAWQTDAFERLRDMPAETILGVPWRDFRDCALAEIALARGLFADATRHAARSIESDDYLPVPRAMAAETFRRAGDAATARTLVAATPPASLTLPARVRLMLTDALLRDAAAREDAHVVLERALDAAVAERILRPFSDPLPELTDLLERHARWGTRHAAFIAAALARSAPATSAGAALSARELEILAYLRTSLTLAEIAEQLFLSTNTVKTHVQSLYRKLGVQNRRQALQLRL